jgi:hypothetical protein
MDESRSAKGISVLSTLLFALRDAIAQIKAPFALRGYTLATFLDSFSYALRCRSNCQAQTVQSGGEWDACL